MAKTKKATKVVDTEKRTVKFTFTDGTSFVAELDKMDEGMVSRLALHGLAQKLGDTYAGDVESPEHEVRGMFEELASGEWSTRKPGEARTALVVEAMSRLLKISIADAQARWDDADDEAKKDTRNDPRVKREVLSIQQARLEASQSTPGKGSLLD